MKGNIKMNNRKRVKEENNDSADEQSPAKKMLPSFSLSSFQKNLKSEQRYKALEEFIHLCRVTKGKNNPAGIFLKKGGKIMEVLNILDGGHCKDLTQVLSVFTALHILLLRIQTEVPEQLQNAEDMCLRLVNNHLNQIHSMLHTKSGARFKKVVLQLLTAVITLNENLAKNILSHVSLSMEVVDEIVLMARPDDKHSVRICFIHFLMAFLVEGSPSIIRLLLKQRIMLTSIVPGLVYDFSNEVVFVLTTLRTKIVENMNISKTQKIHTFNTRVMLGFMALYKWKGPAAFVSKWKEGSHGKDLDTIVNKEQQDAVAEATHSLMLSLCTSFRHGIVFKDHSLGTNNLKQNTLLITILKEIRAPWDHKLLAELVIGIVKVCPEMARMVYSKVGQIFQPRASVAWMRVIKFTTEIILSLELIDLATLDPEPALNLAIGLVAPHNLLSPVAIAGLVHSNPTVRLKTAEFLLAILKAANMVLNVLKNDASEKFTQHLIKFLPDAVVIEKSWSMSSVENGKVSGTDSSPSCSQQMLALVNLMLQYPNHFMVLLDVEVKHVSLAESLVKCLLMDKSGDENLLNTQVKVLELLSLMDIPVLESGKTELCGAISVTLQASSIDGISSIQTQSALGNLLVKYGVLESASADITDELGIWIHCYQAAERVHRPKIRSFLQEVLMLVTANPSQFIEQILEVQQMNFDSSLTRKIKDVTHVDLANQLFEELLTTGKEISSEDLHCTDKAIARSNLKGKSELNNIYSYGISSLLICALDVVTSRNKVESSIEKYLCNVLVHLLHKQNDPRPFLSVTERWISIPAAVGKYMYSWLEDQPLPLSDPFGYYSPECSLSRFLLQPDRLAPELEDTSNLAVILLRARLVTFHIVQLCERNLLTETVMKGGNDVMIALLQSLVSICEHEDSLLLNKFALKFLNIVFKHPVLVCYFSPLHRKKKLHEKLVTNFLLNLLKEVQCHPHIFTDKSPSDLLKEKLLRNITYYLEKSGKVPSKSDTLISAVKLLSLTDSEMCDLISRVKEHMMTDPWKDLFVHLLLSVNNLPFTTVNSIGCVLKDERKKLEQVNNEAIWTVCDALHKYLEKFPHKILHLPNDLFQVLLCKNGLKLVSLMLQHHEACRTNFSKLIEQEESSIFLFPDVLFHLLSIFSKNVSLPLTTLNIVYTKHKQDILKAMQPPLSITNVFSEHHSIIKQLISHCMDVKLCKTLCISLAKNSNGLELFSPFHLSVIEGLQIKGGWQGIPESLLKLLLQQMIQMLQEEAPAEHVLQLCSLLVQHLDDDSWDYVIPDEAWTVIPALFLRAAMKKSNTISGSILMVLSKLLRKSKATRFAEVVFEMMISHSQFLDLVLIHDQNDLKLGLLQLVLVCYQLSPKLMKAVHVPVWLGAYGATLSHCDQVILKILHSVHNNKNVSLHAYRPFLWGDAAVNHYTIRSQAETSLWRIPQATVALELLEMEKVENTIAKFPIFRHLFLDECRKKKSDKEISLNKDHSQNLEPCQPEIYDPAFLLPLFSHLMAPESVVQDYKFVRLGGLALTLASLGSTCKHIRAASLSVISRFHSRLNRKSTVAQLNECFIEALRAGIIEMKEQLRPKASEVAYGKGSTTSKTDHHVNKTENNDGNCEENEHDDGESESEEEDEAEKADSDDDNTSNDPFDWAVRLPSLSSVFVARASLVLINPSHALYNPLYKFLLARSALKLYSIPELKSLSRPSSVDFRSHQLWLLETVQCGIRTRKDVTVAKKSFLFKIIFSMFSSSLSDSSIRILILQIIEATMKVYKGVHTLIKCGLQPWLFSSFRLVCNEKDGNLVVAFIRVLVSLKTVHSAFIPVVNVSPLLFYVPLLIENSDLLCILRMVEFSIPHVSKEHLVIVLRCCFPVLDQEILETCAKQLDIPFSDIAWKVNIQDNEVDEKKSKVSVTLHQKELNITLKSIVHTWLIHSLGRHEGK